MPLFDEKPRITDLKKILMALAIFVWDIVTRGFRQIGSMFNNSTGIFSVSAVSKRIFLYIMAQSHTSDFLKTFEIRLNRMNSTSIPHRLHLNYDCQSPPSARPKRNFLITHQFHIITHV